MSWLAGYGWYDARTKNLSVITTEEFTDWVFAREHIQVLAKESNSLQDGWQKFMVPDADFVLQNRRYVLFIEEVS